jgi:hypothetical protein
MCDQIVVSAVASLLFLKRADSVGTNHLLDIDEINRAIARRIRKTERMDAENFIQYLNAQANGCERDGSALYAAVLRASAIDIGRGGVVAELLQDWKGDPALDAVAMRLLAAIHRMVIKGELPELAKHYPSMGGEPRSPQLEACFLDAIARKREQILPGLEEQVQTNEVRRSAVLLTGFLEVAARTQLPLRMLELGASAGLNHIWDRYRYALGPHCWGDADAEPLIQTAWSGPAPRLDARIEIVERAACDLFPIDISTDAAWQRLDSFIWPDQPVRRARFQKAALRVRASDITIDRSRALPWLKNKLGNVVSGCVTVVFHSIFWHYMSKEDRRAIRREFTRAGTLATITAPLAWLRMEARDLDVCELKLTLWTGSHEPVQGTIARCGFHGQFIEWIGISD